MIDPCQRCGAKPSKDVFIDVQHPNVEEKLIGRVYPLCKSCITELLTYIHNFNDLKVKP